jgi:hypothetical protein
MADSLAGKMYNSSAGIVLNTSGSLSVSQNRWAKFIAENVHLEVLGEHYVTYWVSSRVRLQINPPSTGMWAIQSVRRKVESSLKSPTSKTWLRHQKRTIAGYNSTNQ